MKTRLTTLFAILVLPLCSASAGEFLNEAVVATPILVQAGAGTRLISYGFNNISNAPAYAHFYDAATAGAVTVGTTQQVFMLPVAQSGFLLLAPNGSTQHSFTLGMVIAVTTSPLSSGSSAPSTGLYTQLTYQ